MKFSALSAKQRQPRGDVSSHRTMPALTHHEPGTDSPPLWWVSAGGPSLRHVDRPIMIELTTHA
jgi:hypothetical protein